MKISCMCTFNIFLRFFTNCPRISLNSFRFEVVTSFSFCFCFISFFRIKAKKILLPFCFEAKMMAVFCFRFPSFRLEAKRMAVFHFRFASFHFISLQSKNYGSFSLLFHFVFSLRSIFVSLPFRFISLRSENDGAPYPPLYLRTFASDTAGAALIHQPHNWINISESNLPISALTTMLHPWCRRSWRGWAALTGTL